MKKLLFALPFTALFSCQSTPKTEPLLGDWQAVELQNPQVDAILSQQKTMLDTMTQMPEAPAYGMPEAVTTLDSFKALAYRELDAMREYYRDIASRTRFTFRQDSIAVLTFPEATDSARYRVEGDSLLVLNERALKGVGEERMIMRIRNLTADSLTLLVPDANAENVLRFRKTK